MKYKLFTTKMCPKCPAMKEYMSSQDKIQGELVDASSPEGLDEARKFQVSAVPTVVFVDDDGAEIADIKRCQSKEDVEEVIASG